MQPAAAEVEGDVGRGQNGVGASADAVARFQHDDGEAGIFQRMRGAEAGGAGADDGDIDGGGEGHGEHLIIVIPGCATWPQDPKSHIIASQRMEAGTKSRVMDSGLAPSGAPRNDDYATSCLLFSARLRSLASRNFLRSRIDFGVTSTSSSSSI